MGPLANSTPQVNSYTAAILNNNGQHLFCKYWEPPHRPRALVFVSHGYAEHCLLYEPLAQTLASHSFLVFSHDHGLLVCGGIILGSRVLRMSMNCSTTIRYIYWEVILQQHARLLRVGHGQSEGLRAQIDTFDKFVDDVFKHVDIVRKRFPDLECFICGHSMGGAISILSALRKPEYFKGVVLIGPAVVTNPEVATPFKTAVAKILRWVAPQFPVAALDLSLVCSCPNKVKSMEEDPLRFHGFCKAGFGASLVDACKEIQKKIPTIVFPFIICQGEEDKLCSPEGAVFMYENAASEDKAIKMYPKAYHSLLCEPNGIAEAVTQDIVEWLSARS